MPLGVGAHIKAGIQKGCNYRTCSQFNAQRKKAARGDKQMTSQPFSVFDLDISKQANIC